jgi:hypothetical protein
VDQDADIGGGQAGGLQHGAHAVEHALLGGGLGGEHLGCRALPAVFECQIGEGAADIDREAGRLHCVRLPDCSQVQ